MLSMVFHGFRFHAFMGNILQFSCSILAWKFPHENHGISLWLYAPWFSRESMEFSPCFFHAFPWISHAFSTRVSWLVAKAKKGKVLVPTARTVVLRPCRKHGCLGWLRSFSPTFMNLTFQFSPMVKCKNLDYKKSEIFKHLSFRYLPIFKYGNLNFKNPRFPNICLFDTHL